MVSKPSAAVAAAIANESSPSADQLDQLREKVKAAKELERVKADLEERLKEANEALSKVYYEILPDLMAQAGVAQITVEAWGNMPRVVAKAKPYYHANIAANWPPEKRQAALGWLEENGHGDLIKTEVAANFPRGEHAKALEFARLAKKAGATPALKETVHFQTLTAWLREQVEDKRVLPPLETLGATIGRVVELKEVK